MIYGQNAWDAVATVGVVQMDFYVPSGKVVSGVIWQITNTADPGRGLWSFLLS